MAIISEGRQNHTFALLEAAAIRGERCPQSKPFGPLESQVTSAIAKAGRIRIDIFRGNWRVVTICEGPNTGKQTAPCPVGGRPYKTVFKDHVNWKPRGTVALAR